MRVGDFSHFHIFAFKHAKNARAKKGMVKNSRNLFPQSPNRVSRRRSVLIFSRAQISPSGPADFAPCPSPFFLYFRFYSFSRREQKKSEKFKISGPSTPDSGFLGLKSVKFSAVSEACKKWLGQRIRLLAALSPCSIDGR